jgi:hypothetical protein
MGRGGEGILVGDGGAVCAEWVKTTRRDETIWTARALFTRRLHSHDRVNQSIDQFNSIHSMRLEGGMVAGRSRLHSNTGKQHPL